MFVGWYLGFVLNKDAPLFHSDSTVAIQIFTKIFIEGGPMYFSDRQGRIDTQVNYCNKSQAQKNRVDFIHTLQGLLRQI